VRSARARHVVLVVAGTALVGSGLAITSERPRADAPDFGGVAVAAPVPDRLDPPEQPSEPPPESATIPPGPAAVAAPTGVLILGASVPAPLVPVGVAESGALQLPERPAVLGWYAAGAVPGASAGTAVVAGHLDSAEYGAGPLELLYELEHGNVIEVADAAGGRHRYAVTSRTAYAKAELPAEVFRTDGPPQLALVTCGGEFDERTGQYADNVVVLASLLP
jgi:hypothetical protein